MFRKCVSIASALLILGSAALTASAKEVVYDKPDDAQLFCDFNTAFPGPEVTRRSTSPPATEIIKSGL